MDIKKLTKSLISASTPTLLVGWIHNLMNKVEDLEHEKNTLIKENERLEAQNRKLQGLPAKPTFNNSDKTSDLDKDDDEDDEDDPKNKTSKKRSNAAKKKRRKKKDLEVDKTRRISVRPEDIDTSYKYKGTRKVTVQDILFCRNNIQFELEKYYSKEYGKTAEADLPPGYEGGYFGPGVVAYIKHSYYEGDVTIKKICRILTAIGLKISIRQINRIINDSPDELVHEMEDARVAGIEKEDYQQIDDTYANILGADSAFTIVTCNPSFTYLYTSLSKSRASAIKALSGGKEPVYKLNEQAILVTYTSTKSLKVQLLLKRYKGDRVYTNKEIDDFFKQEDFLKLKPPIIRNIKTAMLVGAYFDGHLGIIGSALVSDDAPQFNNIYDDHGLCWYHELRHFKELEPILLEHSIQMRLFFREVKQLYQALKRWVQNRCDKLRNDIFAWFNDLFKRETGYRLLDLRKKKSLEKMGKLLAPLWADAKIPLDNNESERDLRGRAIKRKISLFDRTWEGVRARDLYISLKQTCRKNGVSFYEFLLDRSGADKNIPQLAEIIRSSCPQS